MAKDLITLAEYKAYAGINSANQDTQIKELIPIVSQFAKSVCRRTFIDYVDDAKVEVFSGGYYLLVSEFPLISVQSVELSTDFGKTYTSLVEYTDYTVDNEVGTIVPLIGTSFARVVNGYRVTYTAGFEVVPEDLKVAVMDLLTYYLKNDMAVKSQRNAGANTVQVEYITKNTLPSHISRVFDLYQANVN